MKLLACIIIIEILYSAGVAGYLLFLLKSKDHVRYQGGHVYVKLKGFDYHVPRDILELYYTIHDPRITEINDKDDKGEDKKPDNPRVFICWSIALFLPRLISRVVRPYENANAG